jgi:nitrogen fixation/metabolism regulation signal transduction histidine kinase
MNLSQKFALLSSFIVFIILSTFTLILIYTRTDQIRTELADKDRIASQTLRQDIGQYFADYYFYQYDLYRDSVIKKLGEYPDVVAFNIYSTDSQLLFDSKELQAPAGTPPPKYASEPNVFIAGLIDELKLYSDITPYEGQETIHVVVHYVDQYDVHRSTFEFYFSTRTVRQAIRQMIITFVILLAVFSSLSIIASFVFVRQITKPINSLTKAAEEYAHGNLTYEPDVSSGDEIGELSEVFSKMAKDLKASQDRLQDQNKNLEQEVKKRTEQLSVQVDEMQRMQKITVDRELKMIELKKEIEALKQELEKRKANS